MKLLAAGADPWATTPAGMTVVHVAAWQAQVEVVKKLVSLRVDINVRSRYGSVPLHEAVLSGDSGIVEDVVKLGGDT